MVAHQQHLSSLRMKIALIAPAEECVPPKKYGGTELVVANLAKGLAERGHEVHLLATADSRSEHATVHPIFEQPIRKKLVQLDSLDNTKLRLAYNYISAARAVEVVASLGCDVVHNHMTWRLLALQEVIPAPLLTTWHGALSEEYMKAVDEYYRDSSFTSISDNQRKRYPHLNYVATVYNGIDVDAFTFNETPEDYILFLGRIAPEKGTRQAIDLALKSGRRLIIAAKLDAVDNEYYEEQVKPFIDGEQIVYVGEVDHEGKNALLKNAAATLGLIQWEEPFGLFVIESLACGTPVIGIARGALPETIVDGVTGFLIGDSLEEAQAALEKIPQLSRRACREHAEKHFSIAKMAEGYEQVYLQLLENAK